MKARIAVASLAVVLAVTGCKSSPSYKSYSDETEEWSWGRNVGAMLKDVGLDFVDIVQLDVGAGEGLLANVRPTKLAQIGVGYVDALKLGWNQRSLGYWRDCRTEGGVSVFYYTDADFEPVYGTRTLFDRGYKIEDWTILHNEDHHWLDLGASLHLLFLGADANLSPKEALDFVLGLLNVPFTLVPIPDLLGIRWERIDLSNDDTRAEVRRKYDLGYIAQPHGLNISTEDPIDPR